MTRVDQPFLKSIRADAAWARATGRGVGVAVIDTGIAGDLPDFQTPRHGSRVIASAVTNPCARDANDQYGHGTHVAGLIAGNGLVYNNGSTASTWASRRARTWSRSRSPTTTATPPSST